MRRYDVVLNVQSIDKTCRKCKVNAMSAPQCRIVCHKIPIQTSLNSIVINWLQRCANTILYFTHSQSTKAIVKVKQIQTYSDMQCMHRFVTPTSFRQVFTAFSSKGCTTLLIRCCTSCTVNQSKKIKKIKRQKNGYPRFVLPASRPGEK